MIYENIFKIIACHLIGDYVLQSDFIAKTKGENLYHLFVHSVLYCLPFYFCFGFDARIITLITSHYLIDIAKARWTITSYAEDQILHYLLAFGLYLRF